jgi:hypothetical protein
VGKWFKASKWCCSTVAGFDKKQRIIYLNLTVIESDAILTKFIAVTPLGRNR